MKDRLCVKRIGLRRLKVVFNLISRIPKFFQRTLLLDCIRLHGIFIPKHIIIMYLFLVIKRQYQSFRNWSAILGLGNKFMPALAYNKAKVLSGLLAIIDKHFTISLLLNTHRISHLITGISFIPWKKAI